MSPTASALKDRVTGVAAWLVEARGKLPVAVAVVLGLLAGGVAYASVRASARAARHGWELTPVLVATRDLPEGTDLDMDMVAKREVPEQFATSSVIRPDGAGTVLGQKLLVPVQAGDPLLWSQFEVARGNDRLAGRVQRKARAITIEASGAQAVGGFLRPNDHVDVIASFRDPASSETSTLTLLQNVLVVATGKFPGGPQPSGAGAESKQISLLLLPEEVELVVLAQELGRLTLVLRNPEDTELQDERTRTTAATLLTGERTRALQKIRNQTIQVIRGVTP